MATDILALADHTGGNRVELDMPPDMAASFRRNAAPTTKFTLAIDAEGAMTIVDMLRNGIPRLLWWRDGELWQNSRWAPMRQRGGGDEEEGGSLTAEYRGPFSTLARRFTPALREFSQVDQGEIAWALIDGTEPCGLRRGTIEATTLRDRTYKRYEIAKGIVNLSNVRGGMDFDVTPVDEGTTMGAFNAYARQGQDRSASLRWEYGDDTSANALSASLQTMYPRNRVWVRGEQDTEGFAEDLASIDRWGPWEYVEQANAGAQRQDTLDDRAAELLRPNPIKVYGFQPDPDAEFQPGRDFWLGDTVGLDAREGSLQESGDVRVNGIDLSPSPDGGTYSVIVEQEVT